MSNLSLFCIACLLSIVVLTHNERVQAQPAPNAPQGYDARQSGGDIVVVGARTGPRLWRVTKDDAEVFILVGVDYIPDDLEWDDRQIKQVLEEAQEVLVMPTADVGAGNQARLLGAMIRTLVFNRGRIMMPKGTNIEDKIGPELASQFRIARARVDARLENAKQKRKSRDENQNEPQTQNENGVDEVDNEALEKQLASLKPERMHPFFQGQNLMSDAIDSANLKRFGAIESQIKKLARKTEARPKPKVRPITEFDIAFSDVKLILKSVRKFSDETNRLCMSEAIAFANEDLLMEASLAQAWAHGDAQYLRAHANEPALGECAKALSKEFGSLKTIGGISITDFDGVGIWIEALTQVMETPGVRLAVVSSNTWLREGGAMDRLLASGFSVTGP